MSGTIRYTMRNIQPIAWEGSGLYQWNESFLIWNKMTQAQIADRVISPDHHPGLYAAFTEENTHEIKPEFLPDELKYYGLHFFTEKTSTKDYITEASSLGWPPGVVYKRFGVILGNATDVIVTLSKKIMSNGETAGWVYNSEDHKITVTIFND